MNTLLPSPVWRVGERDRLAEARLQVELGVPSIVAAILVQRGYADPGDADTFLNPSLDHLADPSLLPDYEPAVKAILGARERKELIFVHGDYDVDGVTSASILHRFLKTIGCEVHTHVPHRMKEGYGIHASAVEAARALGAKLFLTCDCGISAHEQVEAAREAGMKVVVTDHHSIGFELPDAEAVVNPHREDSKYPFAELSGAGVVFRLCEGLTREIGFEPRQFHRAFLDLAALGTIADVMPLIGENRVIAKFGLERLSDTKKVGLQALKKVANANGQLRSYHVGFVLGPRLNASGRIDDAAKALSLLLENDPKKAEELAKEIEIINSERKAEQLRIVEEAIEKVIEDGLHEKNVIVVGNDGWHTGIVGIVASKLVERFHRPVFVMSRDGEKGIYKGSGRSIPNFHLADAIRAHPELLSGGGHAMAAGCTFPADDYEVVQRALHEYAGGVLAPEDLIPTKAADFEIDAKEVTRQSVEALAMLEPFGCANPEPTFVARGVNLVQISPTKNPLHAQVSLRASQGPIIRAMGFSLGERLQDVKPGTLADVMFQPCLDEWNGAKILKWHLRDFTEA